jgi:5,10-methylenetetrahydromethanopterin reductase
MPELPRIAVRLPQELDPLRAIELAVAAEAGGFSALWFAENPFHRGILPVVTACALKTERIGLGIGIVNCYQHHPSLIAMEFAALDELTPGRTVLGIGSGVGARIERLGLAYHPLASVTDTIHIVRALLRGEELTYQGRVFSVDRVALHFRPPRPEMPIYLASMGDQSLALCGRLADGLIISNMCPLGYSERAIAIAQGSAGAAGRPPLAIVQYVPCAIRPDREEARYLAIGAISGMLMTFWPVDDDWPALRQEIVRQSGIGKAEFVGALGRLRRGEPAERVLDGRYVDAFAIAGTAEDCLTRLSQFRHAGVGEVALSFAGDQPASDMAYLAGALRTGPNSE